MVNITGPSASNEGLLRKAFAEIAPLKHLGVFIPQQGELYRPRMTFVDDSTVVVAEYQANARSIDVVAISMNDAYIKSSLAIGHEVSELVALCKRPRITKRRGCHAAVRV
jgi:hypothetical protein